MRCFFLWLLAWFYLWFFTVWIWYSQCRVFVVVICLFVWFLAFFLFDVFWAMVWCLTWIWGKFSVIVPLNMSSVPFSPLLLVFPSWVYYYFCGCSTILGYSVLFCTPFFKNLCFTVSIHISLSSEIISVMSILLMSPPKAFFICYSVFIPNIFWFFLISILLPTLRIYSYMLPAFCVKVIYILIIVILNCYCGNSNILPHLTLVLMISLSLQMCIFLSLC